MITFFADKFNKIVKEKLIKAFRFTNSEDIVPTLPFPVWFKSGLNLDEKRIFKFIRSKFNKVTREIFDKDYQHVGVPIYFTHQARRYKDKVDNNTTNKEKELTATATIGDNHNMTRTYCGALFKKEDKQDQ